MWITMLYTWNLHNIVYQVYLSWRKRIPSYPKTYINLGNKSLRDGMIFFKFFIKCILVSLNLWETKIWKLCRNIQWNINSAIKQNEIMPFAATWMDLEIVILSEVIQIKTNIILYHLYVESKKMIQMNLFTKQK